MPGSKAWLRCSHGYRDMSLGEEHAEHPRGYRACAAVCLGWCSWPWPLHTRSFYGQGKIRLKKNSSRQHQFCQLVWTC